MGIRRYNTKRHRIGSLPVPFRRSARRARYSRELWSHLAMVLALWVSVSVIGYMLWACRGASIGI